MGMTGDFLYGGPASRPTIVGVVGVVAAMNNYATMFHDCSLSLISGMMPILNLTAERT